ncbi:tetratricopeptide repeat protein [bacterium]|nr:tetratricopeptide repeat protein [bacterium]
MKTVTKLLFLCLCICSIHTVWADDTVLLSKGIGLFNAEDYENARKVFNESIKSDKKCHEARYYLGRIAFIEEDYKKALKCFEKSIDVKDDVANYHYWLAMASGQRAGNAGILKKAGLAKKAKKAALQAVALNPTFIDARFFLVQYYTFAPGLFGGSTEKALEQAQAIEKLDEKRGREAFLAVYAKNKEWDKCEHLYKTLITDYPEDVQYSYNLGMMYQDQKFFDKAFRIFEECIKKHPDDLSALYQLGRTSIFSEQQLDRGIDCFKEFIIKSTDDDQPTDADAYWRMGMIYELKLDHEAALFAYQQALVLDESHENAKKAIKKFN